MDKKWVDIAPIKWTLGFLGLALLLVAAAVAIWVPAAQSIVLNTTISTYGEQAQRAATPAEFAATMLQYNQALEEAGMTVGNTSPLKSPHTNMAYFRVRLRSFAEQANAMAQTGNVSVQSSTGLTQLKSSLSNARVSLYGYWLWSQGGSTWAFYIPLGFAVAAVMSIIAAYALPQKVRRGVTVAPSSA